MSLRITLLSSLVIPVALGAFALASRGEGSAVRVTRVERGLERHVYKRLLALARAPVAPEPSAPVAEVDRGEPDDELELGDTDPGEAPLEPLALDSAPRTDVPPDPWVAALPVPDLPSMPVAEQRVALDEAPPRAASESPPTPSAAPEPPLDAPPSAPDPGPPVAIFEPPAGDDSEQGGDPLLPPPVVPL